MNYRYLAYELVIETPFPCPLLPAAPLDAVVDVMVVEGSVPLALENPAASHRMWDAAPGRFLLRGGNRSGRFLVEDGRSITLEKNPKAENERLGVSFFASILTALLQQRGFLVLHANTALTGRGAVAVCGDSGAGKTTTVAGLLARGNKLLADDITVLRLNGDGRVEVLPGAPHLHLCADTAGQFGYDISSVPRYPWRRMKAALPVPYLMADSAAQLDAIYFLKHSAGGRLAVRQLSGMEKFNALQDCIYGPLLPEAHGEMFHLFSRVMEQARVFLVERPADLWTLDDIVGAILHD